jgi:hypothetical protein
MLDGMDAQLLTARPRKMAIAVWIVTMAVAVVAYVVVDRLMNPKIVIQLPGTIPTSAVRGYQQRH